mmetsp:Transcript_2343/g.3986  ORF Transcript_2343/g.3986 Transcript_2343/m.3986 type:complete len:437 (-) Transcript_2343:211-1521(-)
MILLTPTLHHLKLSHYCRSSCSMMFYYDSYRNLFTLSLLVVMMTKSVSLGRWFSKHMSCHHPTAATNQLYYNRNPQNNNKTNNQASNGNPDPQATLLPDYRITAPCKHVISSDEEPRVGQLKGRAARHLFHRPQVQQRPLPPAVRNEQRQVRRVGKLLRHRHAHGLRQPALLELERRLRQLRFGGLVIQVGRAVHVLLGADRVVGQHAHLQAPRLPGGHAGPRQHRLGVEPLRVVHRPPLRLRALPGRVGVGRLPVARRRGVQPLHAHPPGQPVGGRVHLPQVGVVLVLGAGGEDHRVVRVAQHVAGGQHRGGPHRPAVVPRVKGEHLGGQIQVLLEVHHHQPRPAGVAEVVVRAHIVVEERVVAVRQVLGPRLVLEGPINVALWVGLIFQVVVLHLVVGIQEIGILVIQMKVGVAPTEGPNKLVSAHVHLLQCAC